MKSDGNSGEVVMRVTQRRAQKSLAERDHSSELPLRVTSVGRSECSNGIGAAYMCHICYDLNKHSPLSRSQASPFHTSCLDLFLLGFMFRRLSLSESQFHPV